MEVRQLRAVVAVADTGSVTRAAVLLHLVQHAVTRQVHALEEELGAELFVRSRTGMRPTEAGLAFVERARRALTELDRARAEVQPSPEVGGSVAVGLLDSLTEAVAVGLVARVRRDYPGIRLRLMTGYSGHLQEWLESGTVEIALLYDVTTSASVAVRPLFEESLWAVAAPGEWPGGPVPLTELARHPVVMPAPPHGLRTLLDGACARAGVELDGIVEVNTMVTQKRLAASGVGWTVLPAVAVEPDVAAGVFSGGPLPVTRSVVLARSAGRRPSAAMEVVAREVERGVTHAAFPSPGPGYKE
jgi:LysR family transcriptional regulator, nitrogen assimilation regulatory protein